MNTNIEILKREYYNGYEYFITYVHNAWYCAYVIIPENHSLYGVHYDDIENIETHGGFTFSNHHCLVDNQWCIGWDYGHGGDYIPMFGENQEWFGMPCHKWTPEEIEGDCKYVIDQLNDNNI